MPFLLHMQWINFIVKHNLENIHQKKEEFIIYMEL